MLIHTETPTPLASLRRITDHREFKDGEDRRWRISGEKQRSSGGSRSRRGLDLVLDQVDLGEVDLGGAGISAATLSPSLRLPTQGPASLADCPAMSFYFYLYPNMNKLS